MTTREEFRKRVYDLIDAEDFRKYFKKEVDRLLDGGFVNYDVPSSEIYQLAKAVMYIAMENDVKEYKPLIKIVSKRLRI